MKKFKNFTATIAMVIFIYTLYQHNQTNLKRTHLLSIELENAEMDKEIRIMQIKKIGGWDERNWIYTKPN